MTRKLFSRRIKWRQNCPKHMVTLYRGIINISFIVMTIIASHLHYNLIGTETELIYQMFTWSLLKIGCCMKPPSVESIAGNHELTYVFSIITVSMLTILTVFEVIACVQQYYWREFRSGSLASYLVKAVNYSMFQGAAPTRANLYTTKSR